MDGDQMLVVHEADGAHSGDDRGDGVAELACGIDGGNFEHDQAARVRGGGAVREKSMYVAVIATASR